ncbi:MAG TPA: hypothetical protein VH853_13200 [Polyangia bacterium]|jgi:hypothetical protein|nr:hypothetical protein [Polyangia bacterium]
MIQLSRKTLAIAFLGALLLALTTAFVAEAADQKAILAKIKAHYQAAAAAYDDGDLDKTQAQLQQALKVADENGVASNKLVAQVYVLYGVVEVAGLKETDQGVKYFAKAIDISPAIQVPPTMASKAVLAAFDKAENQEGESAATAAPPAAAAETEEAPAPKPAETTRAPKAARSDPDKEKLVDDLAAAKVSESLQEAEKEKLQREKQDQDKAMAGVKGHAQELAKEKADTDRQLADTKARLQQLTKEKQDQDKQLADTKARLQQLTKEKQDQDKQLVASQASEKKEREANNKLAHDKSETEHQLADEKRNLQDLAKQKADADRQKTDTDRQLAAARDEVKREREAKERLERAKADSDRQLADEKRNLQDLAKQKADTDRQLAATRDEAKKEREAKEKLAAARRDADAREAERKAKEQQERAAHDKLADGPDLPAHVTEPISCTIPDEVPSGADLYVHCVPRPSIDAKVIALYYRAGGVLYNVSTMDRSKKGWYTAVIPGGKIAGKVLQYYIEARGGRQDVVGSNGRATSPNIATIRPGKSR